jgi:hypothetical protein
VTALPTSQSDSPHNISHHNDSEDDHTAELEELEDLWRTTAKTGWTPKLYGITKGSTTYLPIPSAPISSKHKVRIYGHKGVSEIAPVILATSGALTPSKSALIVETLLTLSPITS